MNALGIALVWCVVQVTVLALVCGALYWAVHRTRPAAAGPVALTGLLTVAVLSALALSPWPRWSLERLGLARSAGALPNAVATDGLEGHPDGPAATQPDPTEPIDGQDRAQAGPFAAALWWRTFLAELSRARPAGQTSAWRWPAVAAALLLTLMAAGLGWLALGVLAVRSQRARSRPLQDCEILEQVDLLRAELGCRRQVEVRQSDNLVTAATIGWRRPAVLLPAEWTSWTAEQRRAVLAHEIAHVRNSDFLAVLCGQLGLVLHWYHPLLHWLMGRLRLEQELAADAAAAGISGGQRHYLMTIAELALRQPDRPLAWPARSFLPTRTTFLRRIAMLRDSKLCLDRLSPGARMIVVGVVIVCGLLVAGLRGPAARQEAAAADAPAEAVDLSHVPESAVGLFLARPAAVFENPKLDELRELLDEAAGPGRDFPLPMKEIQQAGLVVVSGFKPDALLVTQATRPFDFADFIRGEVPEPVEKQHRGKTYYVSGPGQRGDFAFRPDDRSVVLAHSEEKLQDFMSASKGRRPAFLDAKTWGQFQNDHLLAAVDSRLVREMIGGPVAPREIRAAMMPLAPLWSDTKAIVAGVRVGDQVLLHAVALTESEDKAAKVQNTVEAARVLALNALRLYAEAEKTKTRGADKSVSIAVIETANRCLENLKVEREGTVVRLHGSADLDKIEIAPLARSVRAARTAARRVQSANNLRQIALAMHNYADTYRCFPPAVLYGPDGKTPYSWRVALLPFLEQKALYDHYRFDEPWDGPNNRRLAETRLRVYQCPGEEGQSANASYFALVGPGSVFEKKEGTSFADITDGASNTLLIVEAKRNTPWSKPEDIPYDPDKPIPELGGYFEGGFHAVMCDGSVRFFSKSIPEQTLRRLIHRGDGFAIEGDSLRGPPK